MLFDRPIHESHQGSTDQIKGVGTPGCYHNFLVVLHTHDYTIPLWHIRCRVESFIPILSQ